MIYRNLIIIYILLFIKICIIYSKNVTTVGAIIYSFNDNENSYHRQLVNGFNEYSEKNDLNIKVELEALTPQVSTTEIQDYGNTIDSLLKKKSDKYEVYFYYSAYSKPYGDHFINLKNYLSEEEIKKFDESILKNTCYSKKDELVGLPVYLSITTLFSNQELLKRYNKSVPKTWDELMETSKYIYDEEQKRNNTIIRYNGLINDYNGSVTIYEFINSFRDSNSSPHPELTSKETKEALKKLKEIKDEIGEEIFKAPDSLTIESLFNTGNALFLRYFYYSHIPVYKGSAFPGKKEGVSGGIVIPFNIAISKYSTEEKQKAAIEFLKFVISEEAQKKYIINKSMFTGIMDLYKDKEVCEKVDCEVVTDSQPFSIMNYDEKVFADDNYHAKYRQIMFDYLYNDKPIDDIVKDITSYGVNRKNMGSISIFLSSIFMLWCLLF